MAFQISSNSNTESPIVFFENAHVIKPSLSGESSDLSKWMNL